MLLSQRSIPLDIIILRKGNKMTEIAKGIDVSQWQGRFDWARAASEGIKFAVIKGGGGDGGLYTDERFDENYDGAKKAGISVGAYFYSGALTTAAAVAESDMFCDKILAGKKFDLPVYIDVEDPDMLALGKRNLTDIVKAFCARCEQRGYFVGIYSSLSYFSSMLIDSELKRYSHWVAEWGDRCTYPDESCLGMWQNSSSGTVAGVRCDTDILYVDFPKLIKDKSLNGYKDDDTGKVDGDVNGDGVLSSKDLVRLMKDIASGDTNPSEDINGDGVVNSKDLVALMKKEAE